jgi:CRP-like cAMP-binding protein
MENLETIIGTHPFFADLDPRWLKLIAPCASMVTYAAGRMIYREDDEADQFILILQGRVSIEVFVPGRGPLTIQTIGPEDVLGWSWLFPPYRRQFDARAVEPTTGVALDGRCLRDMVEELHDFGYELIKRFSLVAVTRLRATSRQLLDIYGKHA